MKSNSIIFIVLFIMVAIIVFSGMHEYFDNLNKTFEYKTTRYTPWNKRTINAECKRDNSCIDNTALQNMDITCRGAALSELGLEFKNDNARYKLGCIAIKNKEGIINVDSDKRDVNTGSSLDKIQLYCPSNSVLTSITMDNDSPSGECARARTKLSCRDFNTSAISISDESHLRDLDQLSMKCPSESALAGYSLEKNSRNKYFYNYTCCK